MSKFVEITDIHGITLSVNTDLIFIVENRLQKKGKTGTTIKIAIPGFNNFAFQYVETEMPYNEVMAMINSH